MWKSLLISPTSPKKKKTSQKIHRCKYIRYDGGKNDLRIRKCIVTIGGVIK